jgi:predicted NBD/HSP70 family sugar kinase
MALEVVRTRDKGEAMSHLTRRRIGTVVIAPAAALAAWACTQLIGVNLVVSAGDGKVEPDDVVAAALVGALAGWAVVRLLERRSRQPLRLWTLAGSTALAISVAGPAWVADGASAVALISLHVVTAVVVITGFARTLPAHGHAGEFGRRRTRPGGDPAR